MGDFAVAADSALSTVHRSHHLFRSPVLSASRAPEASGGTRLFMFQSKQKELRKALVKSSSRSRSAHMRPPPRSWHSQPCTHAHKHPHLVDRERTDDSDVLISEPFYISWTPKWCEYRWLEIQGPGSLTEWLGMKREMKRGARGRVFIRFMSSRSCWRVGEFPRTQNCSPGRNQPLLPEPDS